MATVEANGLTIHYSERGSGFPVVFTHGSREDHSQWTPQVDALSKDYRVIIWDRRNCGLTEPKGVAESSEVWVDDLAALLDALGIDEAYVGGVSYGGLLTLEFALRFPERTRAAIIVSATGDGFTPTGEFTVSFPDRRADLGNVRVPCLVVQGLQDTYFPPDAGRALAAGIPGAELALIDAGHGVNQEKPAEFNRVVLDFLARQETKRRAS